MRALVNSAHQAIVRLKSTPHRNQSRVEEIANAFTHGLGVILAFGAGVMLMLAVMEKQNIFFASACCAYVATLIAVFVASTISHIVDDEKTKTRWEALDQGLIFLLITGTYAPYAAFSLREPAWGLLTIAMWVGAFTGFLCKTRYRRASGGIGLWMYYLLALLPMIAVPSALEQITVEHMVLTVASGICFSIGAVFLVLDHHAKFIHVIWHLCVLAGCGFNFAVIYSMALMLHN